MYPSSEVAYSDTFPIISDELRLIWVPIIGWVPTLEILSENSTMLRACSYDETCGIETTILVSKSTGKVIAKKEKRKWKIKNQNGLQENIWVIVLTAGQL